MKVGDILTAKNVCKMEKSKEEALTIGKKYEIRTVKGGEFCITDDQHDPHWFDVDDLGKFFKEVKMNHATTENTIKKIQSLYNEKRSLNDMIARFKRNLLKMESENALDPLKPFLPIQIEKCKFLIEDFTNDIEGLDKEIVELIKGIEV